MALWNPHEELGGNTEEELHEARLILWKGHCSVHGRFKPWHVDQVRKETPEIQVLVHPECMYEVVEKADLNGSTSFIIKTVENASSGSKWAIGTEVNLVNRLQKRCPDKEVRLLSPDLCIARRCIASRRKISRGLWIICWLEMSSTRLLLTKKLRNGRRLLWNE